MTIMMMMVVVVAVVVVVVLRTWSNACNNTVFRFCAPPPRLPHGASAVHGAASGGVPTALSDFLGF